MKRIVVSNIVFFRYLPNPRGNLRLLSPLYPSPRAPFELHPVFQPGCQLATRPHSLKGNPREWRSMNTAGWPGEKLRGLNEKRLETRSDVLRANFEPTALRLVGSDRFDLFASLLRDFSNSRNSRFSFFLCFLFFFILSSQGTNNIINKKYIV